MREIEIEVMEKMKDARGLTMERVSRQVHRFGMLKERGLYQVASWFVL